MTSVFVMMFCLGGHFSLMPNVIKKIYGEEQAAKVYGVSFTYTGLSSLLLLYLSCGSIVDTENVKKVSCYDFMFYVGAGLSAFALLLLLLFFKEEPFSQKDEICKR